MDVRVCVLRQLGSKDKCVTLEMTITTSFPPAESSLYVLPGSTTAPVTRKMLSEGGSNGFHVAWTLWLVMTSQPGPSSHQVFITGIHLK
jgi:hypothetical protein